MRKDAGSRMSNAPIALRTANDQPKAWTVPQEAEVLTRSFFRRQLAHVTL